MSQGAVGPLKGFKQERRGQMQGLQCCGREEGRGLTPGFVEEGTMRGLAWLWGRRGMGD